MVIGAHHSLSVSTATWGTGQIAVGTGKEEIEVETGREYNTEAAVVSLEAPHRLIKPNKIGEIGRENLKQKKCNKTRGDEGKKI